MTRGPLPGSRYFNFELGITVTTALGLAAGELAELLVEGLLALDQQQALFPGVTKPGTGERLIKASVVPMGYARPDEASHLKEAFQDLMARKDRREAKQATYITDRLHFTAAGLHACVLRQRMLIAKLRGIEMDARKPGAIGLIDRDEAEVLIQAAIQLTTQVEELLAPVL